MQTEMGSIAEMLEATAEEPTPLQKEVGRIGRMLGIAVMVIAVVVVTTVLLISDIRTTGDVITVLLLGVVLAGVIGLTDTGEAVVLPLLATQILWINLITDSGPALAMGVDPHADDVMARKPRPLAERVIDARMWSGVIQTGLVMAVVTLLTIDLYLPGGLIEGTHDLATARTAGFTVLVFAQLFNCFNARSEDTSAFRRLFANAWLWGAIALSVLLQVAVVNVGFLNVAFGTGPLTLDQWLVCAAMASVVLWASELRKLVNRAVLARTAKSACAG